MVRGSQLHTFTWGRRGRGGDSHCHDDGDHDDEGKMAEQAPKKDTTMTMVMMITTIMLIMTMTMIMRMTMILISPVNSESK